MLKPASQFGEQLQTFSPLSFFPYIFDLSSLQLEKCFDSVDYDSFHSPSQIGTWTSLLFVCYPFCCPGVTDSSGRLTAINSDGDFLLSFKYAILSDPLGVLNSWNYADESPCAWRGVACAAIPEDLYASLVVAVVLPQSQILGSLLPDLGFVQHLRHLDLSSNFLNGTLSFHLFNASELKILALADNEISGELPELVGGLKALECLNLSDNAFTGKILKSLKELSNLLGKQPHGSYTRTGPSRYKQISTVNATAANPIQDPAAMLCFSD